MSNLDNLRVLIVDDKSFMRSTIRAVLRVIGRFIVSEAPDGETALRFSPRSSRRSCFATSTCRR